MSVLLPVPSICLYGSDCSSALRLRSETVLFCWTPLLGCLLPIALKQDHIGSLVKLLRKSRGGGGEWAERRAKGRVQLGKCCREDTGRRRHVCSSSQGFRKVLSITGSREMITQKWRYQFGKGMSRLELDIRISSGLTGKYCPFQK